MTLTQGQFPKFSKIFKNTWNVRHMRTTASVYCQAKIKIKKSLFTPDLLRIHRFNYIRIINKRNVFNSFTNSKWNSLSFLTIYYSLESTCCSYSDSNTSGWRDQKSMFLFYTWHLLLFRRNSDRNEWQYSFVKNFSSPCVFWKDLTLWNTCNISMDKVLVKVKKRKKRKKKIYSFNAYSRK